MTKEQKYPLAEPASYTPPQMEVIPLRGNSAMLIVSMQVYNEFEGFRNEFQQASDVSDGFNSESMETASGWGDNFFD